MENKLYPQFQQLLSYFDWEKMRLDSHTSLFITPEGNIFCLRLENSKLSHKDFVKKFYENYPAIKELHKDKEVFSSKIEELYAEGIDSKDVIDYYRSSIFDAQYSDPDFFYKFVRTHLNEENIICHDLGFALVTQDMGANQDIELPIRYFGHYITRKQEETLELVLLRLARQSHNLDHESFIRSKELIASKESNKLDNCLQDVM